jgi:DNA-directed RNA polymerase subunit beta
VGFSNLEEVLQMPNLIEVQTKSYEWFLDHGIKEVLSEASGIMDYAGNLVLNFVGHKLYTENPNNSVIECKEKDATYSAPFRVKVQLLNKKTGEIKEAEMFLGDFPLMTESGTFVINGAERVVVSQLVRSPGLYYSDSYDKSGKKLFGLMCIPNRGAWLEYETDISGVCYVHIDKNRKIPATVLIRALGLATDEDIIEYFGEKDDGILATIEKDICKNTEEAIFEIYKKLRPSEPLTLETAQSYVNNLFFDVTKYDLSKVGRYRYNKKLGLHRRIVDRVLSRPAINSITGEVIANKGEKITKEKALLLDRLGVSSVWVKISDDKDIKVISNSMAELSEFVSKKVINKCNIDEKVRLSVLLEILENAKDEKEIINQIKTRESELVPRHIIVEDIFSSINYISCLAHGLGNTDNIDHLGNRRVRCVGELLQAQFRVSFSRLERVIRERMTLNADETEDLTPQSLINIRPIVAAIKEFFGSSPLSQFMDQTNPLAELTHKRRLSALGPGGLSRDRAGYEVRDVHYSHYGRMCPIETPEGPNIGLVSYLATFARINKYGFIEAPFRRIDKKRGKATEEIVYMAADVEDDYIIIQASEPLDKSNRFVNKRLNARNKGEYFEVEVSKADFMDVSARMIFSVATSMIPFLENNDSVRALMGSNMQRQAVPLITTESPIVGTGMEYKAGIDSGVCILAKESGVVKNVSADAISIKYSSKKEETFNLMKFSKSNKNTCFNQFPIVSVGQKVSKNEVIADGPSTDGGEISLGKNILVAFMVWEGYNYEDAILISERLVREDVYTSIHIEEYEMEARDTKLGPEEITRDIPNVSEDALKNLNRDGVIRVGAEVSAGDILVGKVTPKGETELTAEERLLRAIFGEKAREVRDSSLRVPHGSYGIVVDVKIFTGEDDKNELKPGVKKVVRCYIAQKRKISVGDKMAGRHGNKGVVSRILAEEDMPFMEDGTPVDIVLNPLGIPSRMNIGQVLEVHLGFAAKALGWKIISPVFDSVKEKDILSCFEKAGIAETNGKFMLKDGRTGEYFDNAVTVGYIYYLKLHHLIDDKIHARATGPYSLVTQQPLGGKAQFGGQRFGEMEVWALEAYGAAYTLQEILTVKSDDVIGRVKTYEAIVKGQNIPKPGIPESFKVLIKELQSLGLDIKIYGKDDNEIDLRRNFNEEEGFIGLNLPKNFYPLRKKEKPAIESNFTSDYNDKLKSKEPEFLK